MPTLVAPEELAHILYKLEGGHDAVSTDHVRALVTWAQALAAENATLREQLLSAKKDR